MTRLPGLPLLALVLGTALPSLLTTTPARAGRLFLGVHGAASRLAGARLPAGTSEGALSIRPNGGGLDLQIGWALSAAVPLRLILGGSEHRSSDPSTHFSDGHLLIELDHLWNTGHAVRPYMLAGIGGFALSPSRSRPDIQTSGPAATIGGGLMLDLGRRFSLDVNGRAEFINWSEERSVIQNPDGSVITYESPVSRRGHGSRFSVGLLWWL